ncbi:MAG: hypothetical protein ABIQ12_01060 [Opitutaceae bacterium]
MRLIPSCRSVRLAGLFALSVLTLSSSPARAEMKPFEINMDRVKIVDPKGLAASAYFVPSANLVVSCSGSVWAKSKKGGSNAKAHGKFFVNGLDKALLQGLARKVQDDFVTKLRATGATVYTYDDLKAEPIIAGRGRLSSDTKWGFPTWSKDPLTFIRVTPTDEQEFERGMAASPAFWLHSLAKEKKLIVLLPEITFTVPQMWGEVDAGYRRDSAGIAVNSTMLLHGGMVYVDNPQGSFTSIQIQTHDKQPASEVTGTILKMSEDKTTFSAAWKQSSSDWVMTLDPQAFADGILRVSYAINDMTVAQVNKVRK